MELFREAVLFGLMAGIAPSPHTVGMLFQAINRSLSSAITYSFGGLLWDLILIAVAWKGFGNPEWIHKNIFGFQFAAGVYIFWLGTRALKRGAKIKTKVNPSTGRPWFEGWVPRSFIRGVPSKGRRLRGFFWQRFMERKSSLRQRRPVLNLAFH